jgi:hypothetical protein
LSRIIKYILHSGADLSLILNPVLWFISPVYLRYDSPSELDPNMRSLVAKFFFVRLTVIIDDGSW